MTVVELKVLLCELDERAHQLQNSEDRFAKSGRWAQRREFREQRHRVEVRICEVMRRIEALEAGA